LSHHPLNKSKLLLIFWEYDGSTWVILWSPVMVTIVKKKYKHYYGIAHEYSINFRVW